MTRKELVDKINDIASDEGVWLEVDEDLMICRYEGQLELMIYKDKVIIPDFHRLNDGVSFSFDEYVEYIQQLNED